MRKLLNTLYVTSENSYLGLDGENVVVYDDKKEIGRGCLSTHRAITNHKHCCCKEQQLYGCFLL